MSHHQNADEKTSRKGFLKLATKVAITGGAIGQGFMFIRSLAPNVLYEPLKRFRIGKPGKFTDGANLLANERMFVVKQGEEYHNISAVCTHLGCTVNLAKLNQTETVTLPDGKQLDQQWEFHCPCHGSKYRGDGTVYDGPAPRNLPNFELSLSPDNNLVVDTNREVEKDFRLKS